MSSPSGNGRDELPTGWAWATLGDLGRYHNGRGFKKSEWRDAGRPIIRIQNLTDPTKPFNYFDGQVDPRNEVRNGDILVSWAATLDAFRWAGPDAVLNQHIFKVESVISPDFHYYLLKAVLSDLRAQAHGSGMVHITRGRFLSTPVRLPPRAEQNRIVETIEARIADLDSGLQDLGSAELALARFQKSVLAAAVTGRLTARVETSQSGAELLDEILSERQSDRSWAEPEPPPGVELPTNWTWATVDQLASLTQYGSSTRTEKAPEGVPVLRMGNIWDGRLRLDDLKYLPVDHPEFPKLLLDNGDILFNRTNSPELVGKAAVFRGELDPCSFASYLIRIRLDRRYRPELLVYYLNSALGRAWVGSVVSQQVGQANVNGSKLKQLTVPVPPIDEQVMICEMAETALTVVEETRKTIKGARARANQLRHATLKGAVSGIAVPRNPSATLTTKRFETAPVTS